MSVAFLGLQASLWISAKRMHLTGAMPTNSPTMMDQLVTKAGTHLTIRHSQGFPSQFTVVLIAY